MRIHITIAFYTLLFSRFYNLSKQEYGILIMTIVMVIICEMINTSIETYVDIKIKEKNELAGQAKDIAAGAVLLCALLSVAEGIILFWNIEVFLEIFEFFSENPMAVIILILSLIFSYMFVFDTRLEKK